MVKKFIGFLRQSKIIQSEDAILIAFSGGRDSTVLADLLMKIREKERLTLALAHLNHKLRGKESDADAEHCRNAAETYRLPFYYEERDVAVYAKKKKQSIEHAAHVLRYQFLKNTVREHGFSKIATAHTANDQAETILMNFIRGGRWESLRGIPCQRENIIRPLLWCTRDEITEYVQCKNLLWREDSSNADIAYLRNRIRHELIPLLEHNYNQGIIKSLQHWGTLFNELAELADKSGGNQYSKLVVEQNENKLVLNKTMLRAYPKAVQRMIIRKAVQCYFPQSRPMPPPLEFAVVRDIANQQPGKVVHIGGKCELLFEREYIIFQKIEEKDFSYSIEINSNYSWNEGKLKFASNIVTGGHPEEAWDEIIDYTVLENKPLVLRSWHKGDTFIPFGQSGRRKISDFFIDKKIPLYKKRIIPLLVAGNEIIWVCGYRISERARITAHTRKKIGMMCRYEQ